MQKAVVATGLGVLTPIGNNVETFWAGLVNGRSGDQPITSFDISEYRMNRGCELKGFDPKDYFTPRQIRRMDRASMLAVVAAREAVADAGIDLQNYQGRIGVILGTTLSGMISAQEYFRKILCDRQDRALATNLLEYPLYTAGTHLIDKLGIEAEQISISTACSSSLHAIGVGLDLLRTKRCDLVIVGGYDPMAELTYAGFELLKAMSRDGIKPFDAERKGLVLGEGAGILILERQEDAQVRGANIYAEIAGYGSSSDAFHMTAPHSEAAGILQAMKMAMRDAELSLEDIDYINAHGTGTKHNDAAETLGIKRFFGDLAYQIPISSNKSMIGHTLGAAGSIETIAGIISMNKGIIPPTINYSTLDPECDLDYVPNVAREQQIRAFMKNSFGFGGNNAILIVKEVE